MPFIRSLKRSGTAGGRRGTLVAGAVAFCVLALGVGSVRLVAGGADGRNYSRCINSCNHASTSCHDACKSDCDAAFTGNGPERNECNKTCKDTCDESRDECRLVCEANKFPTSPQEP